MNTSNDLEKKIESEHSNPDKRDQAEKAPTGESLKDNKNDKEDDNVYEKTLSKSIESRDHNPPIVKNK